MKVSTKGVLSAMDKRPPKHGEQIGEQLCEKCGQFKGPLRWDERDKRWKCGQCWPVGR